MKKILKIFMPFVLLLLVACQTPKEKVVLKQIKDVVVDASSQPKLKARAVFYNPNNIRMRLKKIAVDIFVNGKKVGNVDQDLKLVIPAQGDFFVDLEVLLAMKEFGFMDTLFGMLGAKKLQVEYKGYLKLNYHGVPIKVPVQYNDEIRLKF